MFRTAWRDPSSLVFVVVVIAGIVMAYFRAARPLSSAELIGLCTLGVLYSAIGTFIFWAAIASGSVRDKMLYLLVQYILGLGMLHLARGNGWLLMLPIVSHSVVLFSPRTAVFPCLIVLATISWDTSRSMAGWLPFFRSAAMLSSVVVFAAIFTNLAVREARARENMERLAAHLEQANRELQANAGVAEETAAIQERNRMAREIHDGLGHYLTAINIQSRLAAALVDQDPARARNAIDKIREMAAAALADVRRSVSALRSDTVPGRHVPDALVPLITGNPQAGPRIELSILGEAHPLSPALELVIYRAVQEGLTNIQKHAEASQAAICLEYRPEEVFLQVQDNGKGADLSTGEMQAVRKSYGLYGLHERVELLGGRMHIETQPGAGFRFEITLPLRQEELHVTDPHPGR